VIGLTVWKDAIDPNTMRSQAFLFVPSLPFGAFCGVTLGYLDANPVENSLETERAPARDFTRLAGWGE
jgi:hypothetical protein